MLMVVAYFCFCGEYVPAFTVVERADASLLPTTRARSRMKSFISVEEVQPVHRDREHGGVGPIVFRRVLAANEFATNVDFVDFTAIPSGSVIGRHYHHGNE